MACQPSSASAVSSWASKSCSWGWAWADGYGVYGYWHSLRLNAGYGDGHVALKLLSETAAGSCQWDTPAGPHNGANHPEYFYMLSHYK